MAYSKVEGLKILGPKTTAYNRLLYEYFAMVGFADLYGTKRDEKGIDKTKLRIKFQRIQTELRAECDSFCRIPLGMTENIAKYWSILGIRGSTNYPNFRLGEKTVLEQELINLSHLKETYIRE